jgi:hypothetical protein
MTADTRLINLKFNRMKNSILLQFHIARSYRSAFHIVLFTEICHVKNKINRFALTTLLITDKIEFSRKFVITMCIY